MGDVIDQPTQAQKKPKRALAFLKPTQQPEPNFDEDLDFTNDVADKAKKDEDDDDPLDMFRRSKDFWPQLKKEAKLPRQATPEPKSDNPKRTLEDSEDDAPVPSSSRRLSKRSKVSDEWIPETYDELYGAPSPPRHSSRPLNQSSPALVATVERAPPASGNSKSKGTGKEKMEPVRSDLSPMSSTRSTRSRSRQPPADIEARDKDEDFWGEGMHRGIRTPSPSKAARKPPSALNRPVSPVVVVDSDSDDGLLDTGPEPKIDEFQHYVDAARERNAAPDTEVKIFIRSQVAAHTDSSPQMAGFTRKATQTLGPVKNAFVQYLRKHGTPVSEEIAEDIFLTWKGLPVYSSVSVVGLGVVVRANGTVVASAREPGYERGGILLEAWTTEGFERHTAEEEQNRLANRDEAVEDISSDDEEEDEEQEPQVAKVRLFLKEKDKEPLGMSAFADTQLRVLIGAYQRQQDIPRDREIRLNFDGEWLDPSMTVEQADIEDRCTVEVYLT